MLNSKSANFFLLVLLICLPGISAAVSSSAILTADNDLESRIVFSAPETEITTINDGENHFTDFKIEGESYTLVEGLPQLPAITRNLIIPWNHRASLEIISDNFSFQNAEAPPLPYSINSESNATIQSVATPDIYPPQPVMVSEPRVFRGNQIVTVTYFPYQYNSVSRQFIHHENVEVLISNTPVEASDAQEIPEAKTLTRDSYRMLHALTMNAPERDDGGATLPLGGYLFVVGVTFDEDDEGELINQLADWKRACGHHVEISWHQEHRSVSNTIYNMIRAGYEEWDPPLEYVCLIGAFGNPSGRSSQFNDVKYGMLGGNSYTSEVAIGRLSATNHNQLEVTIARILSYQSDPYTDDMGWFDLAGGIAEQVGGWLISIDHSIQWITQAARQVGFDDVRTHLSNQNGPQATADQWLRAGANIIFQRGLNFGQSYQRNIYPVYLACGGGHVRDAWTHIWNQGSMNNLRGPSAISGSSHNQSTVSCNVLLSSMGRVLLLDHLPLGWARAYATSMLEYAGVMDRYGVEYYTNDFGYYGDPGQVIWQGRPDRIEVTHPESIAIGSNRIVVEADNVDLEEGIVNALVTITQPGELLYWDFTDENATCIIELDPEWEDEVILTVTAEGLLPYQVTIEIEEAELNLGAFVSEVTEVDGGNENGTLNPGESVELEVTLHNYGTNDVAQEVTATISSASPWVTIENDEMSFDDIQPGDDIISEDLPILRLSPSAPENADLQIVIDISSGDQQFLNFLQIEIVGSNPEFDRVINGSIVENELSNLNVRVRNTGTLDSPDLSAELVSNSWMVQVLDAESHFDRIQSDAVSSLDGDLFLINASTIAVPGSIAPMMLLLRSEEDDIPDTLRFELQIESPGENTPYGPDGYGYVCMDASDEDWDISPEYEWIEISPRDDDREFRGIELPGNRITDFVREIRLPFAFQYYGQEFNHVSISENGFIAMGENLEGLKNADNFPLDRNIGGSFGMIAPYWDNLRVTGNNANIYTFFNEDDHVFIIEWYRVSLVSGNGELTFQIILYDPEFYPFTSGDGMILFQYKQVPQPSRGVTPFYFSTGICSPDCQDGINYVSDNEYPITSDPIVNRHAILFTTAPYNLTGDLFGTVTDVETGEPIERAMVWTSYAQAAFTDADGHWSITNSWASEFSITAGKQSFNDSTLTGFDLGEDEELEINFALLHPELIPEFEELGTVLEPDDNIDFDFEITNTGNGPLQYNIEKHLRGGADLNPWELRESFDFGQIVNDTRLQGVVFIDDHFYISGSNNRVPQIYILNRNGELIDQFPQFEAEDTYGMKDLTWDGEWIWGSVLNTIYAFTMEGELMREIRGPFNPNNNFTWDADRELLWLSSTTSDIVAMDRDGNIVDELERHGMRMYGFSYYTEDVDDHPLYIFHKQVDIGDQIVTKMNTNTGDTLLVAILEGDAGTPNASFITNSYDIYSWVFFAMINDGPNDRLDVWQVDSRRDWFQIDPPTGTIDADESQDYVITFDSESLPPNVRFEGDILFKHNADDGEFVVEVTLDVSGGLREINIVLNEGWNQVSINVLPENHDVPAILAPLVDEDMIILAKDGQGRFYLPEAGFCNIPNWNVVEGYQISVAENCELTVAGNIVPFDTPIDLPEGWNLSAYLPVVPVDAIAALSGIRDQLIIAKDGLGQFYVTEFGFSNMGNLVELQGYQYKVSEDVQLIYQIGENDEGVLALPQEPEHFRMNPGNSGKTAASIENMSVLILGEPLLSGFEVAAISESGQLIGSGCIGTDGLCGLAVWGDDLTTGHVEGAVESEKLSFKLWDGVQEQDITFKPIRGESIWSKDGFTAGKLQFQANQPVEFGVYKCYPNPANGPVRLVYGMPEDGFVSAALFDLGGRQVSTLMNGNAKAGYNDLTWNTTDVSSGVYIIKFKMSNLVKSSKIVVLK
ncbi:MAG: T9SS type A sorting domain-containing protein [Calditrichaeota bacterium]|nr:T9SS type A sorting domain-containing protein [Calditrichota bacterium]